VHLGLELAFEGLVGDKAGVAGLEDVDGLVGGDAGLHGLGQGRAGGVGTRRYRAAVVVAGNGEPAAAQGSKGDGDEFHSDHFYPLFCLFIPDMQV
jgi:hypothetical protein